MYFQCGVCYLESHTKSNFFRYIRSFVLFVKYGIILQYNTDGCMNIRIT